MQLWVFWAEFQIICCCTHQNLNHELKHMFLQCAFLWFFSPSSISSASYETVIITTDQGGNRLLRSLRGTLSAVTMAAMGRVRWGLCMQQLLGGKCRVYYSMETDGVWDSARAFYSTPNSRLKSLHTTRAYPDKVGACVIFVVAYYHSTKM